MATGIPSKKKRGSSKPVEITYAGKKSNTEILAPKTTHPFESVYQSSSLNRLYCGDNFNGLHELVADPAVKGKVALIYIDPPFATKGMFLSRKQRNAYEDNLIGAEYVENLRQRLVLLRELLAADGSIYLHLDENMIFEMKLVMDEVFGAGNYRNMIVRKKCNPKNYTRKAYGNIADYILFYSNGEKYIWNRPVEPLSEQSTKEYHYVESKTGRRYMKVPVHAPGTRNGATGGIWKGELPPPGKHWQYTPEKLDKMDARGEIFWSKNGNPRRKVYLDQHSGVGVQDIWLDYKDAHNQNVRITGYPTEKNPDLLRRIVQASSNPGDMVLDCYAGSGTTLAVADELQRNWIGIDQSTEAISTILKRFEHGLLPMGTYVGKKKKHKDEIPIQQSLFDVLDDLPPANFQKTEISSHSPIRRFSVFIERGAGVDYASIVGQWIKRNNLLKYSVETEPMFAFESSGFGGICYKLHSADKKLAKIMDRVGPCKLAPRNAGFDFLSTTI